MENDTNYDSNSNVANESEKGGEDVKASEEKEENGKNTMNTEQLKGATDGEEEERMKEEIKVTDGSEVEERNKEKSKAVHPIPNEELLTKNIPSESTTHPNPPPRQRKKNRSNNETRETGEEGGERETHEKAHDGRKVNDYKENNEDKGVTDEPEKKTRRRNSNIALQNEMEGTKSKSENAKEDNNTESSIRNRYKNINPKSEDEGKPTVDNNIKETDLEKDKEDKKDTGNSIRNRDKQLNPTSDDEGKPAVENNNKEKDLEKEDSQDNYISVGLKKELGLVNSVGIIVGSIIGTGIFVSPRAVLQYSGSVGMSLLVWVLSGVMCIVGAFCYAELGTMIPQSGGNYTYLYEAYGSFPAFIYLWMTVTISVPGSRAVAALTFANYVLQPFFPDGQPPPDSALRLVGISLMVILTYVNYKKVRWATRVQDLLALTKVFALIVIIVVGVFHLFRGTTQNYEDPMEGTTTNPALLATAFYHTFYAYNGWESLNNIMEELKDPFRNLPRAIAISVTCVIVIYTLTNVAYFAVLPKDLMLASPAVAVTFGNLTLGVMAWTIPVFVACSISGSLNGNTITNSRLLFVSARRGHLPRFLSLVHIENNTPVTSLMFLTFMSMLMFVTSDVRVLINYISFAGNLMAVVCISSFFWFRVKHPDLPRPIKIWIGFPIIYIVLAFFLCVMPVVKQPLEVVAALVILTTGIFVYYFLVYREQKPQCLLNAMDKITYVSQLLFMAVPEERTS